MMNASSIASTIQDGCKKCSRSLDARDFIKNHIEMILKVFANTYCYNEDIQVIVTAISRFMYPEIIRKIVKFYRVTFAKMESTEIPKYLYTHSGLANILIAIREQNEDDYISCFITVGKYQEIVRVLIEKNKKGGFRYTGYALRFFKEMYAARLEIVNAWLENGCEAELDAYGASLISGDGVCEKDDISYFSHLDDNMEQKELSMKPSGEEKLINTFKDAYLANLEKRKNLESNPQVNKQMPNKRRGLASLLLFSTSYIRR